MEHKLIRGGEQFLPFARSRIKALRAAGLAYASQKFEIDGVSIEVRIAGEHEYITLGGGVEKILSGVIKGGTVSELPIVPPATTPTKTLSSYKPTQNAWVYPLKKSPSKPTTSFNDETFLANAETQYETLAASMFSGTMAKVVQVLMGMGVRVTYEHKYLTCHGVTMDSDGKPWLVWIDQAEGVVAMPLPLIKGSAKSKGSKVDAAAKIATLLGGIPDGTSFPTDIEGAITTGTVIRLAAVGSLDDYFGKLRYSDYMGWSFNDSGSEGHNTCYTGAEIGSSVTSYHYRLDITITAKSDTAPASGVAALSLVSSGLLKRTSSDSPRIGFTDTSPTIRGLPTQVDNTALSADTSVTVLVCHVNGVLDKVEYFRQYSRVPVDIDVRDGPSQLLGPGTQVVHREYLILQGGNYVVSTTVPGPRNVIYSKMVTTFSEVDRDEYWSGVSGSLTLRRGQTDVYDQYDRDRTSMVWAYGCRDGYFMYLGVEHSTSGRTIETNGRLPAGEGNGDLVTWPTQKYFSSRPAGGTHTEIYEIDQSASEDYALWGTHSLVTAGTYLNSVASEMLGQHSPAKTWADQYTTTIPGTAVSGKTAKFVQPLGAPIEFDLSSGVPNPEAFWSSVGGKKKLTARASVFSAAAPTEANHAFTTSVFDAAAAAEPPATGSGLLFSGETWPSDTKYNFTGYV